jgi:hypothetical protein
MTRPENGNALLRLAGRKVKGSLASCIPSRIALNHSRAMRTPKTPDWKRQKTGLRAGAANSCKLVDGSVQERREFGETTRHFYCPLILLRFHKISNSRVVVAESHGRWVLVLRFNYLKGTVAKRVSFASMERSISGKVPLRSFTFTGDVGQFALTKINNFGCIL